MSTNTTNGSLPPRKQLEQAMAKPRRIGRAILTFLSAHRDHHELRQAIATATAGLLAGVAAANACAYFLPMWWAAAAGLVWSVIILNFDTMIASVIGARAGKSRWFALAPRVPMVVLSSLVLVELLILKVFTPEIDNFLLRRQQDVAGQDRTQIEDRYIADTKANTARFTEEIGRREKAVGEFQKQIAEKENLSQQAGNRAVDAVRLRRMIQTANGGFYLDASYSRAAQAEQKRIENEVEKLREQLKPEFKHNQDDISRLKSEQIAEQDRITQRRDDDLNALALIPDTPGLMARLVAFEDICKSSPYAWWARLLLGLLLFAVELLPTLTKLGERSDSALIRERLHGLLQEALKSDSLQKHLTLWLEGSSHAYVESYVRDLDNEMGVRERFPAESKQKDPEPVEDADSRIHRLVINRSQPEQRNAAVS